MLTQATSSRMSSQMNFTFSDISVEALRMELSSFASERDWHKFHTPRNLLLALVGEVGELSELFQWRSDAGAKPGLLDWQRSEKSELGDELADVFLYLIRLSDVCGIDLPRAASEKLEKNRSKYPAERCHGSSAKYTAYE